MHTIRCVLEEFLRSFRRSVFRDILLMPMFAISLVMTVIMCSYYFDMGDRFSELTQHIEGSEWHDLQMENGTESFHSLTTARGCRAMIDYYEELCSSYRLFSAATWQEVRIRDTDIRRVFGEQDYTSFLNPERRESFVGEFCESETCKQYELNCVQADVEAWKIFGLRTVEGEGLTEQNTELMEDTDAIPVVLGSNYQGVLKVGDTLELGLAFYVYSCRVVGFLEKGAGIPEMGNVANGNIVLDSYIIFPYGVKPSETLSDVRELKKFAFLDFVALDNGVVEVSGQGKVQEMVNGFQEIAQKYEQEPVCLMETSMGVSLLRKESATSIRVLSVLTVALIGFTFYGLFAAFYDKVQSNSRIYGIYLVNGCPMRVILVSCLLEIAIILFPGILLCWYLFQADNVGFYHMDVILRTACIFAGAAFAVGGIFIAVILRGVDTEHLLRQKE